MNVKEKKEILKALTEGNYEVFIEEPNNVHVCTKYDGSTFLKIVDMDDAKSSNDFGSCTVEVCGYSITCDLNSGEWDGDEEILEDEEIMDAITDADGVLYGEMGGTDESAEVYNKANGTNYDEYYWCEYAPANINDRDELECIDVDIPVSFALCLSHGACSEWTEIDYMGDGLELYSIYKYMAENGLFSKDGEDGEDVEISDEDAKNIKIEHKGGSLYDYIFEQVKDEAENEGFDGDFSQIKYIITISSGIFEKYLGESY